MKTSLRKDRKDRERTVRNLNIFFTQSFQCHIHFYEETDLARSLRVQNTTNTEDNFTTKD